MRPANETKLCESCALPAYRCSCMPERPEPPCSCCFCKHEHAERRSRLLCEAVQAQRAQAAYYYSLECNRKRGFEGTNYFAMQEIGRQQWLHQQSHEKARKCLDALDP